MIIVNITFLDAECVYDQQHQHRLYNLVCSYRGGKYYCNSCTSQGQGLCWQCESCEYAIHDTCVQSTTVFNEGI
jgi:hypothetical protein